MKRLFTCILCGLLAMNLSACSLDFLIENKAAKGTGVQTSVKKSNDGSQVDYSSYVFVGDSRFVGMKSAVAGHEGAKAEFIAKTGQGLSWFKKVAPDLYGKTGKTIIFNFGVNDLKNASQYVEFYNSMPKAFLEKNTLVFMTVNPVDEAKESGHGYNVKNIDIEKFNNTMKSGLDKQYFKMIDTNTYVQLKDFKTTDGIHYSGQTYRLIFDYAVECCEKGKFMRR